MPVNRKSTGVGEVVASGGQGHDQRSGAKADAQEPVARSSRPRPRLLQHDPGYRLSMAAAMTMCTRYRQVSAAIKGRWRPSKIDWRPSRLDHRGSLDGGPADSATASQRRVSHRIDDDARYGVPDWRADELACKPDPVPGHLAVLRSATIHLGPPSPAGSSGLPAGSDGPPSNACAAPACGSLLTLLRVGFTEPPRSPGVLVVSYTTVSPLPRAVARGGLFSVALSRGSPRVAVDNHPALRSPDFPRRRSEDRRRGRPASSSAPTAYSGEITTSDAPRRRRCGIRRR
jgi:hypothetical protein